MEKHLLPKVTFGVLTQNTKGLLTEHKSRCDLPTRVRRSDQQCLTTRGIKTQFQGTWSKMRRCWIRCEDVFVWLEMGFRAGTLKTVINLQNP